MSRSRQWTEVLPLGDILLDAVMAMASRYDHTVECELSLVAVVIAIHFVPLALRRDLYPKPPASI